MSVLKVEELNSKLVDYWSRVTGESVHHMDCTASSFPLYLRQRYSTFQLCRARYEATVLIESWAYDPNLLSNGECVDDLSLILSLNDSPGGSWT